MKINWRQKLTSRKWWMAVTGFATALMVIFKVDSITQEQVIGLIGALSILVAYIVGEGMVDASRINSGSDKIE